MSTEGTSTPAGELPEELVAEILRCILNVADPERVILFGSAAAGRMTPDSDIDLLVIEKEVEDPRRRALLIRRALAGIRRPFDVIVMPSRRFEETHEVIGGIAWPAARYGRVIYEAA